MKYLHAVAREAGLTPEELEERAVETFGTGISTLSRRDISTFIEQVQSEVPSQRLAS